LFLSYLLPLPALRCRFLPDLTGQTCRCRPIHPRLPDQLLQSSRQFLTYLSAL
jgi:hypothetical protein